MFFVSLNGEILMVYGKYTQNTTRYYRRKMG